MDLIYLQDPAVIAAGTVFIGGIYEAFVAEDVWAVSTQALSSGYLDDIFAHMASGRCTALQPTKPLILPGLDYTIVYDHL